MIIQKGDEEDKLFSKRGYAILRHVNDNAEMKKNVMIQKRLSNLI